MTCDSWSGVSTPCIYNVRKSAGLPTHALPRKVRRGLQWVGCSIFDSFCPPAILYPAAMVRTINFSQTQRGPWKPRAAEMVHAKGPARQPEGLEGPNGNERRCQNTPILFELTGLNRAPDLHRLGFSADSPSVTPPRSRKRAGLYSRRGIEERWGSLVSVFGDVGDWLWRTLGPIWVRSTAFTFSWA